MLVMFFFTKDYIDKLKLKWQYIMYRKSIGYR